MDQVTKTKNEFRSRQWAEIIKRCQESSKTVKSWCEENDIPIKSYYYRLRKLRKQACKSNEMVPVQKDPPTIVPVTYRKESREKCITIHTASISIDIYEGATKSTLENVLGVLGITC